MQKTKTTLPYYTEINDFLASIPWPAKTENPNFYCLRLKPAAGQKLVYRPPFKRSFYFFALFRNLGKIEVDYGDQKVYDPDSYLVFHSPNLIYSFAHNNALEGYIIYFKPEAFSFFKPDFHQRFPLFDLLHTNLFKFDHATFNKLVPQLEYVFTAYEESNKDNHLEARLKALGLFSHLEQFALEQDRVNRQVTVQQHLLKRFMQLIDNHYIDKHTVQEYADMLSVTSNHLSQVVKQLTGKNALNFIAERLITEAKSLIHYTNLEVAQIAYQLNFSDPANFGRFFRKHTSLSPSEFRKRRDLRN